MRKLRLEDLQVDSFCTLPALEAGKGTVRGLEASFDQPFTCVDYSCGGATCGGSCNCEPPDTDAPFNPSPP